MIQLTEVFTREHKLKAKKSVTYVEQVNCEENKFLEALAIISENEMDSWYQFFVYTNFYMQLTVAVDLPLNSRPEEQNKPNCCRILSNMSST